MSLVCPNDYSAEAPVRRVPRPAPQTNMSDMIAARMEADMARESVFETPALPFADLPPAIQAGLEAAAVDAVQLILPDHLALFLSMAVAVHGSAQKAFCHLITAGCGEIGLRRLLDAHERAGRP